MVTSTGHQHVPIMWRHLPRGTCQKASKTSDGHNFGKCWPIRTKLGSVMHVNTPDITAPYLSQCATFVAKRSFRHHAPFWPQLRLTKPDSASNRRNRYGVRKLLVSPFEVISVIFCSGEYCGQQRSSKVKFFKNDGFIRNDGHYLGNYNSYAKSKKNKKVSLETLFCCGDVRFQLRSTV